MKRRILSILLALLMLSSLLPVSAFADDEVPQEDGYTESIDGSGDEELPDDEEPADDKELPDDTEEQTGDEELPEDGEPDSGKDLPGDEEQSGDAEEVDGEEQPGDAEESEDEEQPDGEDLDEEQPDDEEELGDEKEIPFHSRTVVNPLYVDVISAEDIPQSETDPEACVAALEQCLTPAEPPVNVGGRRLQRAGYAASNPVYTDSASAGAALKEALLSRESEVRIYYQTETLQSWDALCDAIYAAAIGHTGSPIEGDYLRFENGGYNANGAGPTELDNGEGYYYIFAYTPLYYSSAEQEEALNGTVDALLASMNLSGRSDFDKVSAIYSYLTENVTYDKANLNNNEYLLKYTAYAALVQKTAVCQGFATAFYRLCLASGVDTRIISSNQLNHAWNIVSVNGTYYAADATWDVGKSNYSYFLKGSASWLRNHGSPATLGDQYAISAFAASYPLSESDLNTTLYTISYTLNCGENSPANPKTYSALSDTISLAAPTRAGYRFDGWFSDAAFTRQVEEIPAGSTGNISLYAKWTAYTATIRFNPNGGEGTMESMTISAGERKSLPAVTFTKVGYSFAGWNSKADGSGTAYADRFKFSVAPNRENASLTLYAQWAPITYTIAFNANGGTGSVPAIPDVGYQQQVTLPADGFVFPNHDFIGWNTMADGSGTSFAAGETVQDLSAEAGKTVTLYAQWTGAVYRVQYVLNGGVNNEANPGGYDSNTAAFTLADPSRTGYTFAGWYTDSAFRTRITKIAGGSTGDLTLYAKWTANTYTVAFDSNGGTGSAAKLSCVYDTAKVLSANRFKRTGYTFTGWSTEPDGRVEYADKASIRNLSAKAKDTVTLYAQWEPNRYTVRFNSNGGEGAMDELSCVYDLVQTLPVVQFTRAGYSFKGWALNAKGTGTLYPNAASVSKLSAVNGGIVTLYAQWNPYSYTVRFDSNGGEGAMADLALVQGKATALRANTFKRVGYTFIGWNSKADGTGNAFTNKQRVMITAGRDGATITLYAQWTPNAYTIQFNANKGTGKTEALAMRYDAAAALPGSGFTRTGFTFAGWNTKANGSGIAYAAGDTVLNLSSASKGKITLYAQWTANRCTVRFDSNGGSGSMEPMTLSYGTAQKLTANAFTRTGYSFYGWNTKADGSGTSFANKKTVKSLSTQDGASITLYAQWKANRYTVKFNANGGRGSMSSLSCFYDTAYALTANRFTRSGYVFAGWNTAADGSGQSFSDAASIRNLSPTAGSSVILYAQWRLA